MRWPSAMPGGTSTFRLRRSTRRPRPRHSRHGSRAAGPAPPPTPPPPGPPPRPPAARGPARAHDLPERRARDRLQPAASVAARAGLDRRARLGPVAVTALAARDRVVADLV